MRSLFFLFSICITFSQYFIYEGTNTHDKVNNGNCFISTMLAMEQVGEGITFAENEKSLPYCALSYSCTGRSKVGINLRRRMLLVLDANLVMEDR